jgi:hypothetical protein
MAEPDDDEGPPRGALIALLVLAALVLGGLWLTHRLRDAARLQDCITAGRSNCAPVQANPVTR